MSKAELLAQCGNLFDNCELITVSSDMLINAAALVHKYDFQLFDAIIVASALKADCDILFSEDMQNGMVIGKLTIVNPFT